MPDKTQGGRESFRLLYPPHKPARGTPVPDSSFFHTLQIDQMVSVRRESWRGLPDLRLEQFFTTDTDVLAWRLDVVADLVESEATVLGGEQDGETVTIYHSGLLSRTVDGTTGVITVRHDYYAATREQIESIPGFRYNYQGAYSLDTDHALTLPLQPTD